MPKDRTTMGRGSPQPSYSLPPTGFPPLPPHKLGMVPLCVFPPQMLSSVTSQKSEARGGRRGGEVSGKADGATGPRRGGNVSLRGGGGGQRGVVSQAGEPVAELRDRKGSASQHPGVREQERGEQGQKTKGYWEPGKEQQECAGPASRRRPDGRQGCVAGAEPGALSFPGTLQESGISSHI